MHKIAFIAALAVAANASLETDAPILESKLKALFGEAKPNGGTAPTFV